MATKQNGYKNIWKLSLHKIQKKSLHCQSEIKFRTTLMNTLPQKVITLYSYQSLCITLFGINVFTRT